MKRFLLLSAALHLAILGAVAFRPGPRPGADQPPPLFVELGDPPLPSVPRRAGPAPAPAPARSARAAGLSSRLSSLAPRRPPLRAARPGETPAAASAPLFPGSEELFSPQTDRNSGAFGWIHRRTELSLGYPRELIRHGITGRAEASLSFDSSGRFLPQLLSVRAENPYLRVYVHRLLERSFLGEAIPANHRKWEGQLDARCFVEFAFVNDEAQLSVRSSVPIVGNRLFFSRRSVKNAAEALKWELGPLHGVFPLPAVGVDMLWFAKQLERKKIPVDDLEPYRQDPLFYN